MASLPLLRFCMPGRCDNQFPQSPRWGNHDVLFAVGHFSRVVAARPARPEHQLLDCFSIEAPSRRSRALEGHVAQDLSCSLLNA